MASVLCTSRALGAVGVAVAAAATRSTIACTCPYQHRRRAFTPSSLLHSSISTPTTQSNPLPLRCSRSLSTSSSSSPPSPPPPHSHTLPAITLPSSSSSSSSPPPLSFIQLAKRDGVSSLLGPFHSSGLFDSLLSGLYIDSISSSGVAICHLTVSSAHQNAYGTLHGGCISSLVDVVGTLALLGVDRERAGVSVELNVSFLVGVKVGEKVKIEGKVVKTGRTLGFTQVDIYRVRDGKLAATGRHTKAL